MSTQSGLAVSYVEWKSQGYKDPYTIRTITISKMRYKLGPTPSACEPAAIVRWLRHHKPWLHPPPLRVNPPSWDRPPAATSASSGSVQCIADELSGGTRHVE